MTILLFDESEQFESDEWTLKMSAQGKMLKNHNVRHVLLVHGTFAGNDALGLFDLFEPIDQKLTGSTIITDTLKTQGKKLLNHLAKDIGNYTPEYAQAFGKALNHEISCALFTWGSGNYHLARLKGTIELAETLANIITQNSILETERLLLLGHSHAGQLFALLTTFLENGEKAQRLYKIMENSQHLGNIEELLSNLEKIKTVNLDIVTFGTPVRYSWGDYKKYRLMAIINHRSEANISGLLGTRDGDYVQQWGVEGTDIFPPNEMALNDELNAILDKGRDIPVLIDSLANKSRRQAHTANDKPVGKTLLVDYKDNAATLSERLDITHCVKTLFGHGVYTETRAMLFNTNTIVENLYQ
ncbi:MAG: hypothetical protein LUP96_08025 [Methylococcaceae bacterium]|nr:hypothetical protein [Methylococcaceae bacterium]